MKRDTFCVIAISLSILSMLICYKTYKNIENTRKLMKSNESKLQSFKDNIDIIEDDIYEYKFRRNNLTYVYPKAITIDKDKFRKIAGNITFEEFSNLDNEEFERIIKECKKEGDVIKNEKK